MDLPGFLRSTRSAFAAAAALTSLFGAERLDRGVVAFPVANGGVYVGWRLLADDEPGVGFNVWRAESAGGPWTMVNGKPVTDSTNYLHGGADMKAGHYIVQKSGAAAPTTASAATRVGEQGDVGGFVRVKLAGAYGAGKVGVADFDGDGRLDYLVRAPDVNVDPFYTFAAPTTSNWKKSRETLKIEAYRHDGTFMWRHDLGWAIESGTWYSPMVAYDLDGDGKAEVYCKGGPPGDPRDEHGRVTSGPEYLLKLDGQTGKVLAQLDWPEREGFTMRKGVQGIPTYNQFSRNMIGIAYLDGKRPHLIVQRGKYTQIKLRAYDPQLKLAWKLDIHADNHPNFMGSGMHGMQMADIDNDGRDELIIGSAAIDDDGKPLWATGRGHPDGVYVGDLDPTRPGLEVYHHYEWPQAKHGVSMVDARTGEFIWGYDGPTTHVHSTGLVADLDPTRPGLETYGGESNASQYFLYDVRGTRIGDRSFGTLSPKAVWWDDTPTKSVIAETQLFKLKPPPTGTALSTATTMTVTDVVQGMRPDPSAPKAGKRGALWEGYIGQSFGNFEGTVVAVGDFFGDWREEFIVTLNGEFRVYSTTIPSGNRKVTSLQDRKYRTSVAVQTMGYVFSPIAGGIPLPK